VSEEMDEGFDSRYDRLLKEGAEVADRLDKLNNNRTFANLINIIAFTHFSSYIKTK
jgi:hypothetical protein